MHASRYHLSSIVPTQPRPTPPLQPTASRTRSLAFDRLAVARSRQLNGNSLGGRKAVLSQQTTLSGTSDAVRTRLGRGREADTDASRATGIPLFADQFHGHVWLAVRDRSV